MRFEITIPMEYRQIVEVEAETKDEAIEKALRWDLVQEVGDAEYVRTVLDLDQWEIEC